MSSLRQPATRLSRSAAQAARKRDSKLRDAISLYHFSPSFFPSPTTGPALASGSGSSSSSSSSAQTQDAAYIGHMDSLLDRTVRHDLFGANPNKPTDPGDGNRMPLFYKPDALEAKLRMNAINGPRDGSNLVSTNKAISWGVVGLNLPFKSDPHTGDFIPSNKSSGLGFKEEDSKLSYHDQIKRAFNYTSERVDPFDEALKDRNPTPTPARPHYFVGEDESTTTTTTSAEKQGGEEEVDGEKKEKENPNLDGNKPPQQEYLQRGGSRLVRIAGMDSRSARIRDALFGTVGAGEKPGLEVIRDRMKRE